MPVAGLLPASSHRAIVHFRLAEDRKGSFTYLEEFVRLSLGLVEAVVNL